MQIAGSPEPLAGLHVYSSLTGDQRAAAWKFLDSLPGVSYQQFPDWCQIEGGKCLFFLATSNEKVEGFAVVTVKRSLLASLVHGPLAIDTTLRLHMLQYIVQHLQKKRVPLFRWMPPRGGWAASDGGLCGSVAELHDPALLHWATHHVSLSRSPEEMLQSFSEHHRRAIRKGRACGLQIDEVKSEDGAAAFAKGYAAMYRHRGQKINEEKTVEEFCRLYRFMGQTGQGFFLAAKQEGALLGGVCVLYGGKQALYHRGFLDHAFSHIPVNHLVFYKAMLQSRAAGMHVFDMGGYAIDPPDLQMQNINRFKAGFKGELVHFPATRFFALTLFGRILHRLKTGLQAVSSSKK
jgi:hypothetical protein